MGRISSEKRASVRRDLLRAAAQQFALDGLDGARVDTISISAGYAKGTVYNYFDSKEELFGAVIEEGARRAAQRYAEVEPEVTVRRQLLALARADVSLARDEPALVQVLVREALGFRPTTYPVLVRKLAPYLTVVEGVIAAGQARGEVREDRSAFQLALLFVGMLGLHYVQHWGSGGGWPELDEIPELVVSAFWDGAAVRPRPRGRSR